MVHCKYSISRSLARRWPSAPLARMPRRHKEQALTIDHPAPPVASGSTIAGQRSSLPTNRSLAPGRKPALTLVRAVAMVVLAMVAILLVLPAAIAAQAASAL